MVKKISIKIFIFFLIYLIILSINLNYNKNHEFIFNKNNLTMYENFTNKIKKDSKLSKTEDQLLFTTMLLIVFI